MVGQLAARYPDTWGVIPKGLYIFGGGGLGWGSVCGAPNGAIAVLGQMGAPSAFKLEFLRWYEKSALPTSAMYVDYRSGTWVPGGTATGGWGSAANQLGVPTRNVPKSIAGSVDCHQSRSKWRAVAESWIAVYGQTDRCRMVVYDSAYKLATLINLWKAGGTVTGALSPEASSTGCKQSNCHGTSGYPVGGVQGTADCTPCHTQRIGDNHNL